MRASLLIVLLTSACTAGPSPFTHMSELEVSARGVAFDGVTDDAVVGMWGTTCTVDTATGRVGADYDYPSEVETVTDAGDLFGVDTVVVTSPDNIHVTVVGDGGGFAEGGDIAAPGVTTARLASDAVVGLMGDCSVMWSGDETVTTAFADGDCVGASLSLMPDGRAWVSGEAIGTYLVSPVGAEQVSADTRSVWDASTGLLYAVDADVLRALDEEGIERWALPVDGWLAGFDRLGDRGELAVMVGREGGGGELLVVDGETGLTTAALRTPTPAELVRSSSNGNVLALGLAREVHFFAASGR